jgi:hypothetical protein
VNASPASDALHPTDAVAGSTMPAPGWVDRLFALPLTLPGVPAIWWVALFVVMSVVPASILWATGTQAVGEIDARLWVAGLLAAASVATRNILDGIARRAFRDFLPALRGQPDPARFEAGFVSIPDRSAIAAVAVAEVVITIGYFSDPNSAAQIAASPFVEQAVILGTNWLSIAFSGVLLLSILRQLAAVSRLHRLADVDLFDPGPAHAFARLTSAASISILLAAVAVVADPTAASDTILFGVQVAALLVVAGAAFALPLRGMNGRLVAEKAALLRAVNERIKVTTARVHAAVDADDRSPGSGLHDQLSSLVAERELIGKLSTWPWSPNTIRGLGSAFLVPIVVWAITRLLERYV